ncbi:VCBS repeat-containing protein [Lutibacter sp.]|uniref:VCBS repeat-containing protein n=1 Tax=Lutibacter sp. TaxID=1925666 RepID=UPI0025C2C624|nr:VCBS repeat-containing protein [Lutibacter sp.]MCF6180887.1 VCBS repeat-containing protein [Lutibacter sp.]
MSVVKPVGILLILFSFFVACNSSEPSSKRTLFVSELPEQTGVDFTNIVTESDSLNYFKFPYIYMGGGVSIGDINNDGLQDIFFTSNQNTNKLYLNKGHLKFEDITAKANLAGNKLWNTGVTMIDINNDGFLDIYVSVSGLTQNRKNQLYINNGDLTFTEEAEKYGIADNGNSTQASFIDYDHDGDLDLYVANYPPNKTSAPIVFYKRKMDNPTLEESDHLYRNNGNNTFTDVTKEAGILNFGLALSVSIGDFNQDGWPDIYVSNDFTSPDYFYINTKDGHFKEMAKESFKHITLYGMGSDVGDYNNDGWLDMVQLDMTAADNRRLKANMSGMNLESFWEIVNDGMHYQYMQNSLQLNRGLDAKGNLMFSETSRIAGISSTDWSWSALFADLDNDGWKDIYVTNGSRRDVNNTDYFKQLQKKSRFLKLSMDDIKNIPSEKIENYAFKNNRDLTFTDVSKKWGLNLKGFSNGMAYGDLDNDGDLDIVINNIDSIATIYKNRDNETNKNHYLRFKLNGPKSNLNGLGTKIKIQNKSKIQFQELYLTRGFQSSVEPFIHFGLGNLEKVDSVSVVWPDGKSQLLTNLKTDKVYILNYKEAVENQSKATKKTTKLFRNITAENLISFTHQEVKSDDYLKQPLLPYSFSNLGPKMAKADVNNDGLDDIFIGNGSGFASALFLQQTNGTFKLAINKAFDEDKKFEDMGAAFFDADGDGDQDLYVVSGSYEFNINSPYLQDRLYLNNGKGTFTKSNNLPIVNTSGSVVKPADFDNDGDVDLFVGGRVVPGKYPLPAKSYILQNNGKGIFTDVTEKVAPQYTKLGMVTDAIWTDYNNDKKLDLIVIGDWMPISIFENNGNKFVNKTKEANLQNSTGWWSSIAQGDFDKDGDMDYIVGNLGLNYKSKATIKEPFEVYAKDFDNNGSLDIVLSYYNEGKLYPVRGRSCSSQQNSEVAKKFPSYNQFSVADVTEVYGKDELKNALHYQAKNFASGYLENLGNGKFKFKKLPNLAQLSSINKTLVNDYDGDGNLDCVIAGNLYESEIETPRNDSSIGLFLKGDGKGHFKAISREKSGFYAPGDVKDMISIKTKDNKKYIITSSNRGSLNVIKSFSKK